MVERANMALGTYVGMRAKPLRFELADSILYRGIYSGIDLRFHNVQGRLHYEWVLSSAADLNQIRLRFSEFSRVEVNSAGALLVATSRGMLSHSAPDVFAVKDRRRRIRGSFAVLSNTDVGFRVSGVRAGERIEIDPELSYSTFLGGPDPEGSAANATAPAVSAYGRSADVFIRSTAAAVPDTSTGSDAVSILYRFDCSTPNNPVLTSLAIFPSDSSAFMGLASASDGSAYVMGEVPMDSTLFVPSDALQPQPAGAVAPFVARVERDGSVQRVTFLSGDVRAIAVDADGSGNGVYVSGSVTGNPINLTALPPYMQNPVRAPGPTDLQDAMVLKMDLALRTASYVTFIGGSGTENGVRIAARAGAPSIVVQTSSSDYPAVGGYQSSTASVPGVARRFVTSLDTTGAVAFSNFVGHSVYSPTSVGTYTAGEVLTATHYASTSGARAYEAIKLSAARDAVLFRTSGVTDGTIVFSSITDSDGGMWYGGTSRDPGQATAGAVQASIAGGYDGFIAHVSSGGAIDYFTYLGGEQHEHVADIARSADLTYAVGLTVSNLFPVTAAALQPTPAGSQDAFFSIIRYVPIRVDITKSGSPAQIPLNGRVTYTVRVTNAGDQDLTNLTVQDTAETGLYLFAPQWVTAGMPAWTPVPSNTYRVGGINLAPGRSLDFTVEASGDADGTFANCASVYVSEGTATTSLGTACARTNVLPDGVRLEVEIEDNISGEVSEDTPVYLVVRVTNPTDTGIPAARLIHTPLPGPNTEPMVFTNVASSAPGALADTTIGDGYTYAFDYIGPHETVRIDVNTRGTKAGKRYTEAIASIPGSAEGPWTARSETTVGHVVVANLALTVGSPTVAGSTKTVRVGLNVDPTTVNLPAFLLDVELNVGPGTPFPSYPTNVQLNLTGDNGNATGVWRQHPTTADRWMATFNVIGGLHAGSATIGVPSSVNVLSVRAVVKEPTILDPDGSPPDVSWP
jgi:uncharacterized repeat protein (TIGR01451 family)